LIVAVTLFVGSLLMFLLEPMIARMLLPLLGGAPMVWNTCVLFFQASLLGGYAYAHGVRRWLGPRAHVITYLAVLALACFSLPVAIRSEAPPGSTTPQAWLLLALTGSVGLPFVALAACAPSLQCWFSDGDDPGASDPYFLYAASNAGSLVALILYPGLIEPWLPLAAQRRAWAIGFVLFGLLAASSAFVTRRVRSKGSASARPAVQEGRIEWRERLMWIALAAAPASLMLAVTNYLSTDIAAVPLLWIVPLSIYLLTFVIAFGSQSSTWSRIASRRLPLAAAALTLFMAAGVGGPLWFVIPLHLVTVALASMACHGALAESRPAAFHLTEYYFWLAAGGALGGLFNTFIAPLVFNAVLEYPLALVAATALGAGGLVGRSRSDTSTNRWRSLFPLAVGAVTAAALFAVRESDPPASTLLPVLGIPAFMAFSQAGRPRRFALSLAAMLVAAFLVWSPYGHVLHRERTFFGVYRVTADIGRRTHSLYHGTTLHGVEALEGSDRGEPLTYYHRRGPFGQAFETLPAMSQARQVAVIGLGIGSLAAYATAQQQWTFYEIDPAVERIARTRRFFTHLDDCGSRCRVVLGDARLSLNREPEGRFGLLVLDAFSSDAIPVHLITREALSLYTARLTADGVLAFHVSNRHLSLVPVLANLAADAGLPAVQQFHQATPDEIRTGRSGSQWVVMTRAFETIRPLLEDDRWRRLPPHASGPLWTDDFSNIVSILKF
jgi:spermidine synthase